MTDTSNDAVARLRLAMTNSGNTTTANVLKALADERDAANARADQARDDALVEAADIILADNYDDPDSAAHAILALRDKPAPGATVQDAARVLLAVHDGFMAGEPYEKTEADRLFLAASFGAQAFAVCPQSEARPSAMLRALLLALIEPTDPQLDYLRAKNVVRAITGGKNENINKYIDTRNPNTQPS